MIFTIRHHVLGPVRVVLQEWHGADEINTRREHHQHGEAVTISDQPRPHHVPAAHGTARRNAGVVGMPEPHLAARTTGDALGNGRAAVFLERGRIKHAVGDALALLALGDALADFLGMQF